MGYVAPRTRALRNARRSRRLEPRLPPAAPVPPSPPAFWVWFDHFLTKQQKNSLNYAVDGPQLQERYKFLCAVAWKPFAAQVQRMLQQ